MVDCAKHLKKAPSVEGALKNRKVFGLCYGLPTAQIYWLLKSRPSQGLEADNLVPVCSDLE